MKIAILRVNEDDTQVPNAIWSEWAKNIKEVSSILNNHRNECELILVDTINNVEEIDNWLVNQSYEVIKL